MDLGRLPPALLVALGLGCGPAVPDDGSGSESGSGGEGSTGETSGQTGPGETSSVTTHGTTASTTAVSTSTTTTSPATSEADVETGDPPDKFDLGGTTTGPDPATDSFTTGPCLVPPDGVVEEEPEITDEPISHADGPALDRNAVVERLARADVLPPDVASRLRQPR